MGEWNETEDGWSTEKQQRKERGIVMKHYMERGMKHTRKE
jgi:hypothetical protein